MSFDYIKEDPFKLKEPEPTFVQRRMIVTGTVRIITYRNEENGYSVFHLTSEDGKDIKCTGALDMIAEGDFLSCSGMLKNNERWGEQLICDNIKRGIPTTEESIKNYLSSKVSGVGPTLAEKIVKAYGKDSISILKSDPQRVAKEIKRFSAKTANSVSEQLKVIEGEYESDMFFTKAGISATVALKIFKSFDGMGKEEVYDAIIENPYVLIDKVKGVGFLKADEIGKNIGIPNNSLMRLTHGIEFFLNNKTQADGHIYYPYDQFFGEASEMLGVTWDELKLAVDKLYAEQKVIIPENNRIYLARDYYIEQGSARKLVFLKDHAKPFSFGSNLESEVRKIEKKLNISLDDTQRNAVCTAIREGVCVITGGPGTGKTTTLRVFIEYLKENNISFEMAAPTGRAAKRMSESTNEDAQTVHRLVGIPFNEAEIDADVIIVDESSMVDIYLFNSLVKNIREGSHLILVGDIDQLPSVGAGNVLKDIINSEVIPYTKLENIHRQSAESHIITYAHRINKKLPIDFNKKYEDFFLLKHEDAESVIKRIEFLCKQKLPEHFKITSDDIQILCPTKTGELGTLNLNKRMQDFLNPLTPESHEITVGNMRFRIGDRVMNIRNNYNQEWLLNGEKGLGVFNGDTGVITAINQLGTVYIDVKFIDGKESRYEYEEIADQLTLSYAITVHKSQGSEYPVVIMPVLRSGAPMLFNKALLYTAVTRSRNCCILLAGESEKPFYYMQFNDNSSERYTSLNEKLQEFDINKNGQISFLADTEPEYDLEDNMPDFW